MSAMPSHTQPGLSASSFAKPLIEAAAGHPAKVKNDQLPTSRLSLGKRASRALAYYLIVFSVGSHQLWPGRPMATRPDS